MKSTSKTNSSRSRRIMIATCAVSAIVASGGAVYHGLTKPLTHASEHHYAHPAPPVQPSAPSELRTNVLLIGTDSRPDDPGGNADVIILCSLDRKHQRMAWMSIPRDTRVTYPDGVARKINQGLALGGPALVEVLVSHLLDQPIDHYALTRFDGLVNFIDQIGGINIHVPKNMYYVTGDKQYGVIQLHQGEQNLNGQQALGFVRYRHDALGDIGRTERQQAFLQAVVEQLTKPSNLPRLPQLAQTMWGAFETDMSLLDLISLAKEAEHHATNVTIHETLPGSFHDPNPAIPNDASFWIVNPDQAKYEARQLFEGGTANKNPIQSTTATETWRAPSANTDDTSDGGDMRSAKTVRVSSALVRSGPGPNYPVVASMVRGEKVGVVAQINGWDKVVLSDHSNGYIADWLLSSTEKSHALAISDKTD